MDFVIGVFVGFGVTMATAIVFYRFGTQASFWTGGKTRIHRMDSTPDE